MAKSRSSGIKWAMSDIRLLLLKNFKIQFRHPWSTLIEVLVPCVFVFMIAMFRTTVNVDPYPNATMYDSFNFQNISDKDGHSEKYTLLYLPESNEASQTMEMLLKQLKNDPNSNTFEAQGFNDSKSMTDFYMTHNGSILCGIEFVELSQNNIDFTLRFSSIPKHSSKEIREEWRTRMIMPQMNLPGPREKSDIKGGEPGYAIEGFLYMQHQISIAAAKVLNNQTNSNKIETNYDFEARRFPFPPYIDDIFLVALSSLLPTIIMFSFIYPSVNLTKSLVVEKEKRVKESMKMMGLKEKYHWIAYFIKQVLLTLPSLIIIVVLLCVNMKKDLSILTYSDYFLIFIFFLLYEICNICFCFMISSFFSKANIGGIATGVAFFITFVPFFTAFQQYNEMGKAMKVLHCFLPNTNMAFGVYIVTMKESRGVGVTWDNINEPAFSNDNLTFLLILGMTLVNSFIYLLVTWYVTLAFPGEYGVSLPWYFPFTKKYWTDNDEDSVPININYDEDQFKPTSNENIEPDPSIPAGIIIQNLTKTYDNGNTYSVSNLSFNMFSGQITALLGHNGAGKTTTISILIGLFKPTKGTAIINGHDIRNEINAIRSSLGICPQFNVLFDELTVEEHLEFYCKLKHTELSEKEIQNDITDIIEKLDLVDKRKTQSHQLSGGMQRKLSVGIALIGGSKIVILDEPTSGMDVSARRFIWDLLLQEKQRRTILISTHFMEEADILGDRIAIMANGKLQCCGSSLFLKKRFGAGYHLTIAKESANSDTKTITNVITEMVPSAKLESSVGVEMTYSLPSDETEQFEQLFRKIETDNQLGIENYGISLTTMEEVFLKVGDYAKDKIADMKGNGHNGQYKTKTVVLKNQGLVLFVQQLGALIIKKLLFTKRSPFLLAFQMLIPLLIVNLTLISLRSMPKQKDSPLLHMSIDQFNNPLVTFFHDNATDDLAKQYTNSLDMISRVKDIESTNDVVIEKQITSVNLQVYNYEYMISAIFSKMEKGFKVIAMFNNQAYHTPAIALKYVDEAVIRYAYNLSSFSLRVSNHPMPAANSDQFKVSVLNQINQMQITQCITMGVAFLVGSFAVLVVKERITKGKHLQKLCGVRLGAYWLSYFVVDYAIYMISAILITVTFVLYKEEGLYEKQQSFYMLLGFALQGFAILPMVYCLSFTFNQPATAYARLCLYITILGMVSLISDQVTVSLDLMTANGIIKPIYSMLIPVYNMVKIVQNIMTNFNYYELCNREVIFDDKSFNIQDLCKLYPIIQQNVSKETLVCCREECKKSGFSKCFEFEDNFLAIAEPGIGKYLIYMCACACVYWILLTLIEINVIRELKYQFDKMVRGFSFGKKQVATVDEILMPIDDDVIMEKKRVSSMVPRKNNDENSLIVRNLVKQYGNFTAVDNISYSVRQGECFGLLGVNGAGKTTTFKMITGDEPITSGDIFVNGMNMKKDLRKIQQEIGYCPQFDALLDDLTGRETLTLYSRLRGIKEDLILNQIKELSQLLYFEMHIDKLAGKYSGGNKRKLSTALALLGNPSISFLDEPTTGVDPVARRCLWEAIAIKLNEGCSVVLTSHSMEECEALCNRLIIMANGQICCLGSPLHLKNKFGNGYTVLIKVSPGETIINSMYVRSLSQNSQTESGGLQRLNSVKSMGSEEKLKENLDKVKQFMQQRFPTSNLKARHNNMLHYTIDNDEEASVRCSRIFGELENNKLSLKIEDYSVCQTNLEEIFLTFARAQRDS